MNKLKKITFSIPLLILILSSIVTAQYQQILSQLPPQPVYHSPQPIYHSPQLPQEPKLWNPTSQDIPYFYGYPNSTTLRLDIPLESFLFGVLPLGIDRTLFDKDKFSTEDPAVLAWIHFSSVQGMHNLTWEWFRNYSLNKYQIDNETINCSRDGTLAYSAMYIKDHSPEYMPGEWGVEIYFDDELIDSKSFKIAKTEPSENTSLLPLTWKNLSKGFVGCGRLDLAVLCCDRALNVDPSNSEIWNLKGIYLYHLNGKGNPLEAFEKAIESDHNYGDAWYNEGVYFYNNAENEEAANAFEKALELNPQDAVAWEYKAKALLRLGKYKAAIEALANDAELAPGGYNNRHDPNPTRPDIVGNSVISARQEITNANIRSNASIARGGVQGDLNESLLIPPSKDEDNTIRYGAIRALGEVNNTRAVDQLIQALNDKDSGVRCAAAQTLAKFNEPRVVDALRQALNDNDGTVKWNVEESLTKLNETRSIDPLIQN